MAGNRPLHITDFSSLDFDCSSGKLRIIFPTDSLVDNGDGTYTHTSVDGTIQLIDTNQTVTVSDNGDGTFTIADDNGDTITIDPNTSSVTQTVTAGNEIAVHTDGAGAPTPILETITTIVGDNTAGTITYTAEGGQETVLNICDLIQSCNISALANVASNTDAPADCSTLLFNSTSGEWEAVDPTSALDCTLLTA